MYQGGFHPEFFFLVSFRKTSLVLKKQTFLPDKEMINVLKQFTSVNTLCICIPSYTA